MKLEYHIRMTIHYGGAIQSIFLIDLREQINVACSAG